MSFYQQKFFFLTISIVFTILLVSPQLEAKRPLKGEQWVKKMKPNCLELLSQSLQRGTVPPSGPNPCTNIPGQGNVPCTLNGINAAGSILPKAPALPDSPLLPDQNPQKAPSS